VSSLSLSFLSPFFPFFPLCSKTLTPSILSSFDAQTYDGRNHDRSHRQRSSGKERFVTAFLPSFLPRASSSSSSPSSSLLPLPLSNPSPSEVFPSGHSRRSQEAHCCSDGYQLQEGSVEEVVRRLVPFSRSTRSRLSLQFEEGRLTFFRLLVWV